MYKIWGYVTVFRRNSRKLSKPNPKMLAEFYEQVEIGAFRRSIQGNKDIALVIDHDDERVLASVHAGTLKLKEDSIGLKFEAVIEDVSIIRDIQMHEICGCSFQFKPINEYIKGYCNGVPIRVLKDVELSHVSLIKKPQQTAYIGTIVHYIGEDSGKES